MTIFTGQKNRKGAKRQHDLTATTTIRMGFVRSASDPQRMGRLQVWVPELGNDVESSWITVSYASPFAGSTNIADNVPESESYDGTQKSYGFWAVPPDVGNQVLICFVNNDPSRGFWFGCVYQQNMNHMVPSIGGNTSSDETVNSEFAPSFPPVAEYNKKDTDLDPKKPIRASCDPLTQGLLKQGLARDSERGSNNSSARREDISRVTGWSTPGGNTFTMDDNEANAFIKLRTKTGTQLMVSETSGFIYMITRDGKSWVEVSDGAIEIFSEAPISIRSQDDINLRADRDLNLDAGGDVNIHAGGSLRTFSGQDTNQAAGGNYVAQAGATASILAGSDAAISGSTVGISAAGDVVLDAGGANVRHGAEILDNSGGASAVQPSEAQFKEASSVGGDGLTICSRLPSHEPYNHPINATGEVDGDTVAVVNGDGQTVNQPIVPDNTPVRTIAGFQVSDGVNGCIMKAAQRTGQPYSHLMALIAQESSFRPRAGAKTSSAKGLSQFTDSTWRATYRKYGPNGTVVKNPTVTDDKFDACSSALLGAYLYKENMARLSRAGLPTGPTEGYIMHFLGEGGGPQFLKALRKNPSASASTSVSAAAIRANSNIFKKSGGAIRTNQEVYNILNARVGATVPQWENYRKQHTNSGK